MARLEEDDPGSSEGSATEADQPGLAPATTPECCSLPVMKSKGRRTDKGRLHAVRHGALARHPLEALTHLGEDLKALRRLERRFRAELRPHGIIADLLFDRFWSSYLRCLLAARAEASAFLPADRGASKAARVPALIQADLPTLVVDDEGEAELLTLHPDVLRQLLLVQRYDRHFGREMYRALALLLVLREEGEPGLEQCITKMFGVGKESLQGH
jgi:hypothetical protein